MQEKKNIIKRLSFTFEKTACISIHCKLVPDMVYSSVTPITEVQHDM